MKNSFLFLALMAISIVGHTQSPSYLWGKVFNGPLSDNCLGIALDRANNIYTTGFFQGNADFDPDSGTFMLTSAGSIDVFVSKLDANGQFVWAKGFGGSTQEMGRAVAVDKDGNVYAAGYFQGTVDFDPGPGTFNLSAVGSNCGFIVKLSADGDFLWAKAFIPSTSSGSSSIVALVTDINGNVYTAGNFTNTVNFDPDGAQTLTATNAGFVSKLDENGSYVWAKMFTGNPLVSSITVDAGGNTFTSGYFNGVVDFDPSNAVNNLSSTNVNSAFIAKLDAAGNAAWAVKVGGNDNTRASNVVLDTYGNIIATGDFSGTTDFDPGVAQQNISATGTKSAFILKLDHDGKFIWTKILGGVYTNSRYADITAALIVLDKTGSIYLTGTTGGTIDFDPDANSTYNLEAHGYADIFIEKLDSFGHFVWAKTMGDGSHGSVGMRIAVDTMDHVYATGTFAQAIDFDFTNGTDTLRSSGSDNVFIIKVSNATNVWPGDANANGIVDNLDILTIGQNYGNTGAIRPNASINWRSEQCANWNDTIWTGINSKHVDCDGNGTINAKDTLAVSRNYGQGYTKAFSSLNNSGAGLFLDTLATDTILSGHTVNLSINLGNYTVYDIYGLAFSINYDSNMIDTSSIQLTAPVSWLGVQDSDLLAFHKNLGSLSQTDIALVRTDRNQVNGLGQVATFSFATKQNAGGVLPLSISRATAIKYDGTKIPLSCGQIDTLFVLTVTGINELSNSLDVQISPNPAHDNLQVSFAKIPNTVLTLQVYTVTGTLALSDILDGQMNTIHISSLASGIYILKVQDENRNTSISKVVKR